MIFFDSKQLHQNFFPRFLLFVFLRNEVRNQPFKRNPSIESGQNPDMNPSAADGNTGCMIWPVLSVLFQKAS